MRTSSVWTAKGGTAELYFAQVYGGSADNVYYMTSVETLKVMLTDFASIEHLVILAHSFDETVLFGRTAVQLQSDFAPYMPRVSKLTIDGCTGGKRPVQLYDMATAFGLTELQAWTYFHHIEVWGRPEATPTPNEDLAAVLAFASPYIPRRASGTSVPASELQATFDEAGTFAVATEFFTYNLEDQLTFETLTDRFTHRPAAAGSVDPGPDAVGGRVSTVSRRKAGHHVQIRRRSRGDHRSGTGGPAVPHRNPTVIRSPRAASRAWP